MPALLLSLCLLAMQMLGLMHGVTHGVKHGALPTASPGMTSASTATTQGLDSAAPTAPRAFTAHEAGSADCTLLDHLLLGHGTVTAQAAVALHALADSPPLWRGTAPHSAAHAAPQARGPPRV